MSTFETSTIAEQRQTIGELETPVIQIWDGVLALPLVGSIDTQRAQVMNERLLERIVATGSEIVLVDISGVPVVDTSLSRHLLETVAAARLEKRPQRTKAASQPSTGTPCSSRNWMRSIRCS